MSKIPQEAIEAACNATVLGVNEDDRPVHLSKREALVAIKAAIPFLTAVATRAQGAEVEPVAWLIEHPTNPHEGKDLSFADLTKDDRKAGFTSEPLYKRPPAPQPTDREKALEEALRPFAKLAKVYDPDEGDDEDKCWVHEYTPTLGDLRRARAALASQTDRAEGEIDG